MERKRLAKLRISVPPELKAYTKKWTGSATDVSRTFERNFVSEPVELIPTVTLID